MEAGPEQLLKAEALSDRAEWTQKWEQSQMFPAPGHEYTIASVSGRSVVLSLPPGLPRSERTTGSYLLNFPLWIGSWASAPGLTRRSLRLPKQSWQPADEREDRSPHRMIHGCCNLPYRTLKRYVDSNCKFSQTA